MTISKNWKFSYLLILILVSPSAWADPTAFPLLHSEEWVEFKALLEHDLGVKDVLAVDEYCEQEIARSGLDKNSVEQRRLCIKAVLDKTGSRSKLIEIPGSPAQNREDKGDIQVSEIENTLYLGLNRLSPNLHVEILQRISGLEAQKKASFSRVILDLRGNTGGAIAATSGILALFVGENQKPLKIVGKTQKSTSPVVTSLEYWTFPPTRVEIPKIQSNLKKAKVVVLIDRNTASGAEAIAMALREKGAKILGEVSRGMAEAFEVNKIGDDLIKLHSGQLYTAKNKTWDGQGVTPDVLLQHGPDAPNEIGHSQNDAWINQAAAYLKNK